MIILYYTLSCKWYWNVSFTIFSKKKKILNPFHARRLILYPIKTGIKWFYLLGYPWRNLCHLGYQKSSSIRYAIKKLRPIFSKAVGMLLLLKLGVHCRFFFFEFWEISQISYFIEHLRTIWVTFWWLNSSGIIILSGFLPIFAKNPNKTSI